MATKDQACKTYDRIERSSQFMGSACYEHGFHAVKFPGSLRLSKCFLLSFDKLHPFSFRSLRLRNILRHSKHFEGMAFVVKQYFAFGMDITPLAIRWMRPYSISKGFFRLRASSMAFKNSALLSGDIVIKTRSYFGFTNCGSRPYIL